MGVPNFFECVLNLAQEKKKNKQYFTSYALPETISVENKAFKNEAINELYDAIKQLSEVDRAVIILFLEEKPYKEIAEVLGTNPNNIGVRVKRIKQRLKKN